MEIRSMQSPTASSAPPTPTTPVGFINVTKGCGLPGGLEASIAPADMLNVLSAQRESVNTADGNSKRDYLNNRLRTIKIYLIQFYFILFSFVSSPSSHILLMQ